MTSVATAAAAIGEAELSAVVLRALGNPDARIVEWGCTPLTAINGWGEYRGLFRFAGDAEVAGQRRAWSLILKVIRRTPGSSDDPAHPAFWKREALAYGSDLLSDMRGLRPAQCHGVELRDADTLTLWLEDLEDEYPEGWPLSRYGLAAAHLGEMNGAYLVHGRVLDQPWLMRRGAELRGAPARAMESLIRDSATWQHPGVRRVFSEADVLRASEQWEHRHALRVALSELPITLCHNDAHSQNLFSRRRADGTQETVALDWELIGVGPVATDITYLVIATLRRFAVNVADANELEAIVLDGYIAGLERSGYRVDRAEIELAFTAAIALRVGLVPQTLSLIMNPAQRANQERTWRRPADELIACWSRVAHFVLDRVPRARELLVKRDAATSPPCSDS